MKILVLGNGAREHSLCYAISRSPLTTSLFCVPGNYGISQLAECKDLDLDDFNSIHSYCVEKSIDLIVVGPEVPLVAGIVDYFCLLYTSPSPRDGTSSRMPSSA